MIKTIKKNEKLDGLLKEGLVMVDIFATWCGPCKMLSPNIEHVANELNIDLIKVDSDENMDIAIKYKVMSVPTILLFKDGKLIDTKIGYMEVDDIKSWIQSNL